MATHALSAPDVTDREYRQLVEFLYHEAQLLDARRLAAWLELLTDDVHYRVVTPTVRMLEEQQPGQEVVFMEEDKGSLRTRVLQLTTAAYTVAENPPSLTRRFVTNIVAVRGDDDGQFEVHSNVLLYRSRGTQLPPYLFSAQRQDGVRLVGGHLRLARRLVVLDDTVLGTRNMSVFF
jgi:3-phenylpropionate/cinnamic acid dioxygenase small subunit